MSDTGAFFDYLKAIDRIRQERKAARKRVREPETVPPRADAPVDYLAVSRAWEKELAARGER